MSNTSYIKMYAVYINGKAHHLAIGYFNIRSSVGGSEGVGKMRSFIPPRVHSSGTRNSKWDKKS